MNTVIAMALLAVYEIGQPSTAANVMTTLSSALALIGAFQLTRMDDPNFSTSAQWLSKPKNWVVEEGRRRVVWMIISLARWVAVVSARAPQALRRSDIQLLLPVSNNAWVSAVSGSSQCAPVLGEFFLIDYKGNTRPGTELILQANGCSTSGPFARFVQAQDFVAQLQEFKQSQHDPAHDPQTQHKRGSELYTAMQRFIQEFPLDWEQQISRRDECMLDSTTLCIAHWWVSPYKEFLTLGVRVYYFMDHNHNKSR
ncbi:unnamed protein product [Clonostachys solani]|uniref:Xylanolytic transcriptional activator regulatory domain-containing protein n=1 Tax=Clonostachys solani TaxID=160281 RepID=A0A9N9ZM52_9HYPO|nr:unnamed protein product [Clonostachys solani]